jgi:hypothetical protein
MAANWHIHECDHCDNHVVCYKLRCKLKKKKFCSSCVHRKRRGALPESQITLPMKYASDLAGFCENIDGSWGMVLADGRTLPVTEEYIRDGVWHA